MERKITLVGDIGDNTPKVIYDTIRNLTKDVDLVRVDINSGGGGVAHAVASYNILKASPVPVHTHNLGQVSSSANLIYLAGTIRTAEPIFKFLFHPATINGSDDMPYATVMEKLRILDSDLNNYAAIIRRELPVFCEEHDILELLKYQTVIITDANEATRYGILTPQQETT